MKVTGWKTRAGELLRIYGRRIVGGGILLCLLALAVSYIRPKQQLQTVTVNMGAEEERLARLEPGVTVSYVCETRGYPMAGIQVGIGKYGRQLDTGWLHVWVYGEGQETLYSESLLALADMDDGQYVYVPFDNYERCAGELSIAFSYEPEGGEENFPGIYVNGETVEDARTYVDGELLDGGLKCYYVYRVDYYPLLYDLCLALFLLAGVFFLTEKGPGRRKCGGNEDETSTVG